MFNKYRPLGWVLLCLCHSDSHTFSPSLGGSKKIGIRTCRILSFNRVSGEFSTGSLFEWISLAAPYTHSPQQRNQQAASWSKALAEVPEASLFRAGEKSLCLAPGFGACFSMEGAITWSVVPSAGKVSSCISGLRGSPLALGQSSSWQAATHRGPLALGTPPTNLLNSPHHCFY